MAEIKVQLRQLIDDRSSPSRIVGDLDVTSSEDFPLSLTLQHFDIRDINSRSGAFSKTFDIPATNNNNRILRHLHKSGFDSQYSEVLSRIDAVIYADNLPIIAGKIRITKVTKSEHPISYSCEFVGDNMDWASGLKNKELKDLRFTSFADVKNAEYVFDNCDLLRPEVVTDTTTGSTSPIANYIGNDFHHFSPNMDRILFPLLSVGEGLSDHNQVTYGDYIPAFYIKNIWDNIFKTQGYTVVSTFCESDYFKSLIMPFEFEKRAEQVNNKYGRIKLTSGSATGNIQTFLHNSPQTLQPNFLIGTGSINERTNLHAYASGSASGTRGRYLFGGNEVVDDYDEPASLTSGNIQRGTSANNSTMANIYNGTMLCVNESGDHEIDFNIKARFFRTLSSDSLAFSAQLEIWQGADDDGADANGLYQEANHLENNSGNPHPNWTRLWHKEYTVVQDAPADVTKTWNPSTPIQVSGVGTKYIACLKITPSYPAQFNGDSTSFEFVGDSHFTISGQADMSVGEDITDPHFFLPDGKQSDFIMGIAHMYNLHFHTDPISKTVFVEPYDFFYESKTKAYDWSDKVDYSKNTSEEFPHELKSEIRVKYKDASSDAFLERFNARNLIDWGEYKEIDSNSHFQDGTYTIENKFFSPTFNWYEPEYKDAEVGHDQGEAPLIPIYHQEYSYLQAARFADRADKRFQIGARILLTAPLYSGAAGSKVYTAYESAQTGQLTTYSYNLSQLLQPSDAEKDNFTRANFIHFDNIADPDGASNRYRLQYSTGNYSEEKAFNVPLNTDIMIDPNLSFNDVIYYHENGDDFSDGFTDDTNPDTTHRLRGLFYNFYNRMFKQLKARPRIRITYFKLDYDDILRLDFRRLVFLEGTYYRINKIVDYRPHKIESTKVELMEFFDLGINDVNDGDVMNIVNGLNI